MMAVTAPLTKGLLRKNNLMEMHRGKKSKTEAFIKNIKVKNT